MSIVLITGSNGFIGSHFAEFCLSKGFQVRCMVRKTSNLQWLKSLNVEYVYADLSDIAALQEAVDRVEYIIHLGGKTKSTTREGFFEANETGTQNLLQAVHEVNSKLKRFVYVSSQAASGPSHGLIPRKESDDPVPVTWYGESKLAGEKAVLDYAGQFPVTIIRPPSVYGPRDTDVFEVFKAVRWYIKPILGWQKRYASFIYVADLIRGIYLSMISNNAIGETFFLVSDPIVSWQNINDVIAKAMNRKGVPIHLPVFIFACIALIREMISRITGKPSIINWQKMNEFKQRFWICDGQKALTMLKFNAEYTLDRGIRETLTWYLDNGWLS
ncbi:NAD-dependent epimerase/dehydratase family protein [bacterium]